MCSVRAITYGGRAVLYKLTSEGYAHKHIMPINQIRVFATASSLSLPHQGALSASQTAWLLPIGPEFSLYNTTQPTPNIQ